MQKSKLDNAGRFDEFYHQFYQDRWNSLKDSFLNESSPVSLSPSLSKPYFLDRASIVAANCLPVKEGDLVLDMCAAPGGKSLVLALKLNGTGHLVSNDRSAARRIRLRNVISESLPENLRQNITVTGHDSTTWGLFEQDTYDCILLDAPCSSERHVIKDETALSQWSPSRPKRLAIQQYAMLSAAFTAVKPGGFILYSTCSICPMENQDVIAKLARKHSGEFEEITDIDDQGEKTEILDHGRIILPDTSANLGPLFFCLLRRTR